MSYGATGTPIKFSEGLEGQTKMCDRTQSLPRMQERTVSKAVRVKLKVQWRLQEVECVRNEECLLRRRTNREGRLPKLQAMRAAKARPSG